MENFVKIEREEMEEKIIRLVEMMRGLNAGGSLDLMPYEIIKSFIRGEFGEYYRRDILDSE